MKKLIVSLSLLIAFSTSALAVEYQPNVSNDSTVLKNAKAMPNYETTVLAEVDDCFEFNTENYLPKNFNAFAGMFEEINIAETDEAFDFDISDYLPVNFDAYVGIYIDYGSVEEADEAFDFNTEDFLPVGFNAELKLSSIVEINIEEEDEPFDFDTSKYLSKNFDAHAGLLYTTENTVLNCMSFPSL